MPPFLCWVCRHLGILQWSERSGQTDHTILHHPMQPHATPCHPTPSCATPRHPAPSSANLRHPTVQLLQGFLSHSCCYFLRLTDHDVTTWRISRPKGFLILKSFLIFFFFEASSFWLHSHLGNQAIAVLWPECETQDIWVLRAQRGSRSFYIGMKSVWWRSWLSTEEFNITASTSRVRRRPCFSTLSF